MHFILSTLNHFNKMAATFSGFNPFKLREIKITDHVYGHGSYATVIELDYMGLKCAGKKIHEVLLMQGNWTYTVQRFEEECRILSRIRHPNVVQFLGVHFQEGVQAPILVMEFLPYSLVGCIEQYGVFPEEVSYSVLHDVAKGLCYLHNQTPKIIHRDLSSNNVLVTRDMTAKISDLGVARILDLPYSQLKYMTQTPGTPAFMPPEVMVAKPNYDTSVDVFSYGIMMVHVLSGKWPEPQIGPIRMEKGRLIPVSEAERREELLKIIGNEHPLLKLIHRCIHNDPTMRAQSNELVCYLADLVNKVSSSFANQLDILKHIERDKEEKQKLNEELQQKEQVILAQEERFGHEIEQLRQQNSELIEQNRALSSENSELMEQITRDEEVMTSTIQLLKQTIERNHQQFTDKTRTDEDDLSQQTQGIQTRSSNQTKTKQTDSISANSSQSASSTVDEQRIEKQGPSLATSSSSTHDLWEIDHAEVRIIEKIGEGFFSTTYKGILNNTTQVAIKKPNFVTGADFMEEVAVMKLLQEHPNILHLYGTCLRKKPFYIITELMQHGTLYHCLHSIDHSIWTNFSQAVCRMSAQIASGMEHMEQQRCIHRNLSSQSILVGENLIVKVGSFTVAKKLEPGQEVFVAPRSESFKPSFRWSSPETVLHNQFSHKSDVWSFAMLLYKIATRGRSPYSEIHDHELLEQIKKDPKTLQSYFYPVNPSVISDIIRRCMHVNPTDRPSFASLSKEMKKLTKNNTSN